MLTFIIKNDNYVALQYFGSRKAHEWFNTIQYDSPILSAYTIA